MIKFKSYLKIMSVIVLSFFVSSFVASTVFVHNTPQFRSNPAVYIASRVRNSYSSLMARIFPSKTKDGKAPTVALDDSKARNTATQVMTDLANAPLKTVTKGIYAKESGTKRMTIINTSEVESVQLTYQMNGETITITIPKAYYDSLGLSDDEIINMSKKAGQSP